MSEIKRYDAKHFGDFEMVENTQGEWVRWEDVQELLKPRRMTYEEIVEAIKLVCEPPSITGDNEG